MNVNGRWQMIRYKEKRWDSKRMLDSGGMPSSHSATVTALAVAVALQYGTSGPVFAIAVVLACVVRIIRKPFSFFLLLCRNFFIYFFVSLFCEMFLLSLFGSIIPYLGRIISDSGINNIWDKYNSLLFPIGKNKLINKIQN